MTDGIIQRVCNKKYERSDHWFTQITIEELQSELIEEIKKEYRINAIDHTRYEFKFLKKIIGDSQ